MRLPSDTFVNNSYTLEGLEGKNPFAGSFLTACSSFLLSAVTQASNCLHLGCPVETAATLVSENVASGNTTFKSNANNECNFK